MKNEYCDWAKKEMRLQRYEVWS